MIKAETAAKCARIEERIRWYFANMIVKMTKETYRVTKAIDFVIHGEVPNLIKMAMRIKFHDFEIMKATDIADKFCDLTRERLKEREIGMAGRNITG